MTYRRGMNAILNGDLFSFSIGCDCEFLSHLNDLLLREFAFGVPFSFVVCAVTSSVSVVVSLCSQFKMCGIDAFASALMTDDKTIGYLAVREFPRYSVRQVGCSTTTKSSISTSICSS